MKIHSRGRRPLPTGEGLSLRKDVRFSPQQFTDVHAAARSEGLTMSAWIRRKAVEAAARVRRGPGGSR